jgi:pSer/pThr/pTyr-binding forkhead associated (FHA) protein
LENSPLFVDDKRVDTRWELMDGMTIQLGNNKEIQFRFELLTENEDNKLPSVPRTETPNRKTGKHKEPLKSIIKPLTLTTNGCSSLNKENTHTNNVDFDSNESKEICPDSCSEICKLRKQLEVYFTRIQELEQIHLNDSQTILELRTANVKLATELQRLRTEDFEQLSVEELEKIEDKEKARLQNIAKTKLQKQIEAQLCDICQQKPHNTMVFLGKQCLCDECFDCHLSSIF